MTGEEHPLRLQLAGDWQVCPVPLESDIAPEHLTFSDAVTVPDAVHLQPALYPDRPYWGEHLRTINTQAWFFRRVFRAPTLRQRRVRLLFEGVDYYCTVWLNDRQIGRHEGHFAPFSFDITNVLHSDAENTLVVRVSAPWDAPTTNGTYPTDHVLRGLVKGLYEHGEGVIPPNVNPIGIWRPVYLLFDEGISIDRLRIQAGTDGTATVRLTVTNATESDWDGRMHLQITAENHQGRGTSAELPLHLPRGCHTIEHTLHVSDPALWWSWDQGEPNLYQLTAQLSETTGKALSIHTETFGFRTLVLERSPQRFTYKLNGRPIFIRGSSYLPDLYLSRCTRASLARDIQLARDANLNLLRVHVHVSPAELYDQCDRMGMLVWQDFELNWMHSVSEEFEQRARLLQQEMIDTLYNHPAIITWSCYNEPTMIFARRSNLEKRPAPALYRDACRQDPTRSVFLCSGQMEHDWQRAGDVHTYYGALWSQRYTDVYRHKARLNTEFGFETPAHPDTLRIYPDCWERLQHLEGQIANLWAYQAELVRFHIEHYRRLRADGCAGYIHFWLTDLVPQVGCGVLDAERRPKGGYEALKQASAPLNIALEYDARRPHALWVFNDTPNDYPNLRLCWKVQDTGGQVVEQGECCVEVAASASQRVLSVDWRAEQCDRIALWLQTAEATVLASNCYVHPFQPLKRPRGYPWKFDHYLGVKVFDRPDAPSLANQTKHPIIRRVPVALREYAAEWALRQRLPHWLVRIIARIAG